ncbi:hypothetical protein DPMN_045587 [Dreissena polymorpha]|uniref:Uncharacterized protein n=1 Tax=Dreissena polymorpha TaxID=45954 RepID=A0A9D4D4M3_DREPO|nr:hypothetical protein DPMN_045587 [Dreissena polymorpha]
MWCPYLGQCCLSKTSIAWRQSSRGGKGGKGIPADSKSHGHVKISNAPMLLRIKDDTENILIGLKSS